jgi:uncharacterized membrane protein YhaH (DUF805 family)
MVATTVVSAAGYIVDDRVLAGARVWAKPLKFGISFALYGISLAWMVAQVRRPRLQRLAWWSGTVLAGAVAVEMAAIVLQAARGQLSHYNRATPFDSAVFGVMGGMIGVIYTATLIIGVVLVVIRVRDRVFDRALRLGVLISVLGLSVGFLMLQPTPAQQAQGEAAMVRGAHGVGVVDGGPGLPLLGWSTTGGDLRVAHFVGMHALQLLPLAALAITTLARGRLSERLQLQAVLLIGAVYGGVFVVTLWQALRGQPLIAPDLLTLSAGAVLFVFAALGATVIAAAARRERRRSMPEGAAGVGGAR